MEYFSKLTPDQLYREIHTWRDVASRVTSNEARMAAEQMAGLAEAWYIRRTTKE